MGGERLASDGRFDQYDNGRIGLNSEETQVTPKAFRGPAVRALEMEEAQTRP